MSDSETATAEKSDVEELSDELLEIDLASVDDDTVRARVKSIEPRGDDDIKITVELPGGGTHSERMEKPVPWSEKFKFARVVEEQGYHAGTVHLLEGERIKVERTDKDDWKIVDPDPYAEVPFFAPTTMAYLKGVFHGGAMPSLITLIWWMNGHLSDIAMTESGNPDPTMLEATQEAARTAVEILPAMMMFVLLLSLVAGILGR